MADVKFRVKRFSQQPGQLQFEDKWPLMRPTVLKLLRQEHVNRHEWQDLFWLVHSVCLWDEKGAQKVNDNLKEDIVNFIKLTKEQVSAKQDESALLRSYIYEWGKFFTQCDYLPKPFNQLEVSLQGKSSSSSMQKKSQGDESIVRKLMLDLWNTNIFMGIKDTLQKSAMKLVEAERNGEAFDSQLVIGVRQSYVNLCSDTENKLKIYQEHFERAYIDATAQFYAVHAHQYLIDNGVHEYMKYAQQKLEEEEKRGQRYLETTKDSKSLEKLIKECVYQLVEKYKEQILKECSYMIHRNETAKLKLMFNLMIRVKDGFLPMLADLEKYIREQGINDMKTHAETITVEPQRYVEKLLELFMRFQTLVQNAFESHFQFTTSRDKAYQDVVNDLSIFKLDLPTKSRNQAGSKTTAESRCPELLAKYCDMLLKKSSVSRKQTSEDIEKKLKEVLIVLKYISNKDVFMKYHQSYLSRRLINETSADSEKEENMVEWLREIGMPAEYINRLSRMFQDIKVSSDMNQEFKTATKNNNEISADQINIKILNAGAWARGSDRVMVTLPTELEDLIPQVEEFYKKKHNGRKLQWHHMYSTGVITFENEMGKYDLEVTTFQMTVLFAWNLRPHDKLSFESLRLATELPENELKRTLLSLTNARAKSLVLLSEPEVKTFKDITDSTLFSVNQKFAVYGKNGKEQKRGRQNLVQTLLVPTEKNQEEDREGIVQLRIYRVQEAIVKIMKMRKKISNAQLQMELIDILKNMFLPSKKMIKEQIEWLIENKYMKRDEENINQFIYVA